MKKLALLISSFLFLFLVYCSSSKTSELSTESDSLGKNDHTRYHIDLSVFKNSEIYSIDGPWEFYWMELLQPTKLKSDSDYEIPAKNKFQQKSPDLLLNEFRPWTKSKLNNAGLPAFGYATYRTILRIPKSGMQLGIFYPHLFSASRIWVNGVELAHKGKVSEQLDLIQSSRKNTEVYFTVPSHELEIILHVANSHFYQGGPRGKLLIGSEKSIKNHIVKNIILDVIVFGLILGSMLYHLFIYFLNKDNKPFLFFSIVCLSFLLRLPFHNMKLYGIFFDEIPWSTQALFLHCLNIISMLAVVYFLNSLFPRSIKSYFFIIHWIGAIVAFALGLINERLLSLVNFYYVLIFLPLYLVQSSYLIFFKITERKSFFLMAIGVLGLSVFCFLALILNYFGIDSGAYLISGFLIYILFQALALSRFFTIALENRTQLKLQLTQENQRALTKQREELQILMHDSLGGELTDIHVFLERNINTNTEKYDKIVLNNLFNKTTSIIQSFRNQLLYIEDLNVAYENLFAGLNLTILRRYSDAGREVDFNLPDILLEKDFQDKIYNNQKDMLINLFYLFTEICTNDLKYGIGESYWDIDYKNACLYIQQKNQIKSLHHEMELIPKAGLARVEKMEGTLHAVVDKDKYILNISIPVTPSIPN
ncbi:7TM-DISM domain-containing protein [Leptospira sp. GIMC2001]|uniref:7TM-DISM domain-containing protein n=1 Tax=Leptospira sp. GIMC2001 TaxID=1513297 RepID=UPI0023492669|nr:7TM-DISM domain-containing protein [Leptospira sp. GIMC2001]WCL47788.1 7TM-DISM domain-containing protein [Leptospira sp. GIMC2001]